MNLTKKEKELVKSYEKGEWQSVKNLKASIKQHQKCAIATFKKDKRVNIRITERDLEGIRLIALEEGLPYQTFLGSIIHKYVSKRLQHT